MSRKMIKYRRLVGNPLLITVIFILGISGLCSFLPAAEVIEPTSPVKVLGRCGRGALLEISSQRVLLLAGSGYEMGYQQGYLLKSDVKKLVNTVLFTAKTAQIAGEKDPLIGGLPQAFKRTRNFIDERYHQEMRGLAAGAGITLPDVQLANIFPELFHCSGFALFNQATKGGRLYHGRILDYLTEIGLQDYALVVVVKPDGFHPFVTVGFAGFVGSVTGMNNQQVAVGEMGGRGEGLWDGMPMSFLVRKVLEEADDLKEALSLFENTPRTCHYYYVVSDGKIPDARGLACTPDKFDLIAPGESHPLLPHPFPDVVLMSAGDRYEHLAELTKEHYGHIDLNSALDMMNRPVAMKSCLHRVLFAPAEEKLWVANAISPIGCEKYAACFQPYYPYDLNELLKMIPDVAPADAAPIPNAKKNQAP